LGWQLEHDDDWLLPIRPDLNDEEVDVPCAAPTFRELEVV
jgi:hypothetical protein